MALRFIFDRPAAKGEVKPAFGALLDKTGGGTLTSEVVTFGCRLNAYESELMKGRAEEAGLKDAIVFNTCAVTAEAVRQARQSIRRAKRDRPGRRIIVAGCAAQTEPETFATMPEVDLVLGNAEKLQAPAYRIPEFGLADEEKARVSDIFAVHDTAPQMVAAFGTRVRAFVQVQNGCDHRCTFCIIPYARGNSRSVPMGAVVEQSRRLYENGAREIVLTGVDITSYGGDLPGRPRLGTLARHILKHVPKLPRLRLSSIDCVEADPELLRAVADDDRLMPHLHLSLQSGDDIILKRMKRRHLRADAIRFCDTIRRARPDVIFGADLIAGFPTETEAAFANTLALAEECGLAFLHVFPFSPRTGTPAARMPQVRREIVKERAARLRDVAGNLLANRLAAEIGTRRPVLFEQPGFGRTEHFIPVDVGDSRRGEIADVLIEGAEGERLRGAKVKAPADRHEARRGRDGLLAAPGSG